MRNILVVSAALALSGMGATAWASPVKGNFARQVEVPGGRVYQFTRTFKGGERACVIVVGDHKPIVRLKLTVQDTKGNVIGTDDYGGDLCTVIWYPPRDGDYVISIAVPHIETDDPRSDFNKLYIAVK